MFLPFQKTDNLPKCCDFQVFWKYFVKLKRVKLKCLQKVRFKMLVSYIALECVLIRSAITDVNGTILQQRQFQLDYTSINFTEIKLLHVISSL
jgi:hypothetical protein